MSIAAAAPTDVPEGPPAWDLLVPEGSAVVVGGMPGAGKTTLIARLSRPGVRTVDPDRIRARWRRVVGRRVPYRWYRPLVHVEHHLRVAVALLRPGTVLVHDPATRAASRRLWAALARLGGHPAHLLLLDVGADEARHSQRVRGRVVRAGPMRVHARRWRRLLGDLTADGAGGDVVGREGYRRWQVLDRDAAAALRRLVTTRR